MSYGEPRKPRFWPELRAGLLRTLPYFVAGAIVSSVVGFIVKALP